MAGKLLALAALLTAASPAAAMTPNAVTALDRGLHALYDLDYAQSRREFRRLVELEPDNPFGYLFESGAIWWQASQEYGLFKDTPTLQGLFEQDVDAAIRKADGLVDSKDKTARVEGYFAAGMALGTRGQWDIMKGRYVQAYLDGKHALKSLKKCSKLDSEYEDVYLGLGVYDYEAAHLSGFARLGLFVGVRGDEKRGLERLSRAAEKGRYASRQAAQFLLSIYLIDKQDWQSAMGVLQRLRQDFPESVYFQSLELMLRWRFGEKEKSLELGRAVFERAKSDPAGFNRKLLSLVCGLVGERCLDRDQASAARAWLTAAIEAAPPSSRDDAPYLSLLHLYRGYMADALGRTDEAASDYKWVLEHPDFADAHERAAACQDEGCPAKELLLYLHALSKDGEKPSPR